MSIKVLVADDSITIQKVIGIIFGGDEYSLTVVDNGKAAVEKAREITPDILLIDALMPGMTGYEVAEAVRLTPSLAFTPILILTGSFEPFDEEKAKKCGADDFIAKPFESQQIIAKVKELLELGSSRAQAAQVTPPEPAPEVSAPIFNIPTPIEPEVPQPATPADIWGAFTPDVEPPVETAAAPVVAAPSADEFEPDVFAIVTEENDAQLVQSPETTDTSPPHTGSQWIPVEENTFEFEEEIIESPLQTTFAEQAVPVEETTFGDIAFEDGEATSAVPDFSTVPEPDVIASAPDFSTVPEPDVTVSAPDFADFIAPVQSFEEPPALESVSFTEMATPAAAPPPVVSLTEEQLKVALSQASKEVIERIVWEVVPDLAETLIREAIRKIKEGV